MLTTTRPHSALVRINCRRNPLAAADKLIVMVIAVALSVDVPHQAHLFAGLSVRRKKTAAVDILIEQRVTTT